MQEEIAAVLRGADFRAAASQSVSDELTARVLQRVQEVLGTEYKVATHCLYMRNALVGFETFSYNVWDAGRDGIAVCDFKTDTLRFIMTVWGVSC